MIFHTQGGLRTASRIGFKHPPGGVVGATGDMVSHIFLRGKAVVSKATDLFEIMYVGGWRLAGAGGCLSAWGWMVSHTVRL